MIDATILLLVYYFDPEDCNRPVVKDIVAKYSGIYLPFDTYLYTPLKGVFSNVILYDYLRRASEIGHKAMNREIIEIVRREHPKYVIWTSYHWDIFPDTLDTLKKEGSTIIGWYFDDDWRFDNYSKYWVSHLDINVTNSVEAVQKYQALNARVIQTTPNTGIAYYPELYQLEKKYDVSFVGSRAYAKRDQLFQEIEASGIHIETFGFGWPRGYVTFEEMIEIFQKSKINLNFSMGNPENGGVLQIKGRVFQVCMAGGFLLTEYAPGTEKYFEIGKEIVCFQNTKELVDMISYYLTHDKERLAIAYAGWERACREYTSMAMIAKVFEEMEDTNKQTLLVKPKKQRKPIKVRGQMASYYMDWTLAFLNEKEKGLWTGALRLVIRNYPFAVPFEWMGAYLIRFLPSPLQNVVRKSYQFFKNICRAMKSYFLSLWHTIRQYRIRSLIIVPIILAAKIVVVLPAPIRDFIRKTYHKYRG